MATHRGRVRVGPRRRDDDSPAIGRLGRILEPTLALVALVALAGVTLAARLPAAPLAPAAIDARAALAAAADAFARDAARGGSGIVVEVVAVSTLLARPDGPRIEIPDPNDPTRVAALADRYDVGASAALGAIAGDDFFLQLYAGTIDPAAPLDPAALIPTLASLVRDGVVWRNDGEGWYETDLGPGIGLDPRTVALLPALLREAGAPVSVARDPATAPAAAIAATARIEQAPGLMAVDAAPFTELNEPITFELDDAGRLVALRAVMRNTLVEQFDLRVETIIRFRYDVPVAIPSPVPLAPPVAPPVEPGAPEDADR